MKKLLGIPGLTTTRSKDATRGPGIATSNKKLLKDATRGPGIATSNKKLLKDATRGSWPRC